MDAERVFRLFQRILRDDALQAAVFAPGFRERAAEFALTPEEIEIALEYGRNTEAAHWPVTTYRVRLERELRSGLENWCPLTAALLKAHGQDLRALTHGFLTATGWHDHGPFVHSALCELLAHLGRLPELRGVPGLADAIAVEAASHALTRRLADLPASAWLAPPRPPLLLPEGSYQRTPGSAVVTTEHILTPLLMDPEQAGAVPLEPGRQHILVYLTSMDEGVGYGVISESARILFDALEQPLSLARAVALLAPERRDAEDRARASLTRFLNLGVIRPVGDSQAAHPSSTEISSFGWDEVASTRGSASTPCFDALVDSLIQGCGELDGKRVLDAGMGTGTSTLALARRGAHALGIDISARAVEEASAYARDAGGAGAERVSFQVMDATRLALEDASFDVVTCLKSLWCFPDIAAALREFHRVLRPGGRLVVQLWGADEQCTMLTAGGSVVDRFVSRQGSSGERKVDDTDLTPDKLEQYARTAGFTGPFAPPATHARGWDVASAAQYWDLFRSLGDATYHVYAAQSDAERAAMDEQWRMESSALRGPSGAVSLRLEWHIFTFLKA